MSLVELIQELVDNPQELAAFKQAPAAYIIRKEPALTSRLPTLLGDDPNNFQEIGTVMGIKFEVPRPHSIVDLPVSLDLPVSVTAHTAFFAEFTYTEGELDKTISYRLLPHSYINFDIAPVGFVLHLCYVNPNNEDDYAQVLMIQTGNAVKPYDGYNLADKQVNLTMSRGEYILVSDDEPFETTASIKYDPAAKETIDIDLKFNDRRKPPQK